MILALLVAAAQLPFDPVRFFNGRTHGDGQLKELLKPSHAVTVESFGRRERDGSLTLSQRVNEAGKPPRVRVWRLRRVSPTQFTGTLSDANGPVVAWAEGPSIRIRYTMKGGLAVEQYLTPLPSGRALDNRMTIRKLGIVVANMREYISRR